MNNPLHAVGEITFEEAEANSWNYGDMLRIETAFDAPLKALEDYLMHCQQQQTVGRPIDAAYWEARCLSLLMAIEILYGLEETYDLSK